jgi:hypothetical protein
MRSLFLLILVPSLALATPSTLRHQGHLTSAAGGPVEGPVDLDVSIYAAASEGVPLYTEAFDGIAVVGGYFSVELGANGAGLPSTLFNGADRWVGLSVDDGDEFTRTPISAVPYALHAASAQQVVSFASGTCDTAHMGALEYRDAEGGLFLCSGIEWFRIGTGAPVGPWADDSYAFRNTLTIQGSTGAGTGYAVRLRVGSQAGGGTVDLHLNGNAEAFPTVQDDGGDLAFYDADGTTALPFWVESVSGGVATVWVRVAESLAADRDIQLYYGKTGATDLSDGNATFLLFDDFEGATLDPAVWTVSGNASLSGGQLVVGDAIADQDFVDSVATFGVGTQMVWAGRINNEGYTFAGDGLAGVIMFLSAWNQTTIRTWTEGDVRTIPGTSKGSTYHYQVARPLDGTGQTWLDGVFYDAGPVVNTIPATARWQSGTNSDLVQYVLVSPFVDPQPSVSATSGETAR